MTRGGLHLGPERWEELIALASRLDLNWRRCALKVESKHIVPETSGVYAIEIPTPFQLATPDHLQRKEVMPIRYPAYIGESSSNIRSRFVEHTGPKAQDRILCARRLPSPLNLPRWFVWTEIRDSSHIQALESILIECFQPPCNKIGGVKLSDGIPAGSMELR
jgi:hypothetical protein